MLHHAAEKLRPMGEAFPARAFHEYYKLKYLGGIDVKLPNGQVVTVTRSTTELDRARFSEYYDRVEADLAERGVFLYDMEAVK